MEKKIATENKPWAGNLGSLRRAMRKVLAKNQFDFSATPPIRDSQPREKRNSEKKRVTPLKSREGVKDETLRYETLTGFKPQVERLGERILSYTYSGLKLTEMGAQPGSIHMARVDLPWGGRAILLERVSPNHEAQDSLTLVVNWEKKLVTWVRADGVTTIVNSKENDSALLANLLTRQIAAVLPATERVKSLKDLQKKWKIAVADKIQNVSQAFKNKNYNGAASIDAGLLTQEILPGGKRVSQMVSSRIGSTVSVNSETGEVKTGDYGGHEIWQEESGKFSLREGWDNDRERNFTSSIDNQPASIKHGRGQYPVEKSLMIASFTDGLRSIFRGKRQGVMGRIDQAFDGGIEGKLDLTELEKLLENKRYTSSVDDVSLIAISLPRKKQEN